MRRRLASILLIAALALLLAASASAAESSADPSDIAAAFMAQLDRDGIAYTDLGRNSGRDYGIEIRFSGERLREHVIELVIDSDGKGFSAREQDLLAYDQEQLPEVLRVLNLLNDRYNFVEFIADTASHTVCAEHYGVLLGSAERSAGLLRSGCSYMTRIVDLAWDTLTGSIPSPGEPEEPDIPEDPDRADSAFPGTWRFSALMTDVEGIEGGLTLTAEAIGSDEFFLLRLSEDGTAELTSPYEEGTAAGVWDLSEEGAVLSVYGEKIPLFLEDENTLLADATEAAGFILRMVRGAE